jgi:UDP-N-acetylglucosamine acyltransferase
MQNIHATAVIGKDVQIGKGVVIGPYCVIEDGVTLEDEVWLGSHVVIRGITKLGMGTKIHAFATLGAPPQDLKYKGERTKLTIGKNNSIREYVNISVGTATGTGETKIGDNNLLMAYTHIAHDCEIGNGCIFANGIQLAGHVVVGNNVVFGGMSGGHQYCRFGDFAMVAAGSIVVQDAAPYCTVQGDHATTLGLNVTGLKRGGFTSEQRSAIKQMFKIFFKDQLTVEEAIQKISDTIPASAERDKFLEFVKSSKRGICR